MAEAGYLDELLFNDTLKGIVQRLAVPVPTANILANIQLKQPKCSPSFCQWQSRYSAFDELKAAAAQIRWGYGTPYTSPRSIQRSLNMEDADHLSQARNSRTRRRRSIHTIEPALRQIALDKLPSEILKAIFDEIEDFDDVLCLGLACRRLWLLALREHLDRIRALLSPWAGEKIVIAGELCQDEGYPPNLFTKDEIVALRAESVPDDLGWEWDSSHEDGGYQRVEEYKVNMRSFTMVEFVTACPGSPRQVELERIPRLATQRRLDPAIDAVLEQLRVYDNAYLPNTEKWMLRNLTTKELVRAEAIALKPEYINGRNIDRLGFHNVLIARTVWCSENIKRMEKIREYVPHKGPWAGHAFDICCQTMHEQEVAASATEWTDVSEQVAAETYRLWEAKFGPDWRTVVCGPDFIQQNTGYRGYGW